jgi:hypothetical protein
LVKYWSPQSASSSFFQFLDMGIEGRLSSLQSSRHTMLSITLFYFYIFSMLMIKRVDKFVFGEINNFELCFYQVLIYFFYKFFYFLMNSKIFINKTLNLLVISSIPCFQVYRVCSYSPQLVWCCSTSSQW